MLPSIDGRWKWFGLPFRFTRAVEHEWVQALVPLPHDVRVAEAVDHLMLALHARVRDLADLGAVEVRPPTAVEVATKRNDALWVDEIDESVAHVALIAVIDGQKTVSQTFGGVKP